MKPRIIHYRYVHCVDNGEPVDVLMPAGFAKALGLGPYIDPCGGFTKAIQPVPESGYEVVGWARCSRKDHFNKSTGRLIAELRATLFARGLRASADSIDTLLGERAWERTQLADPANPRWNLEVVML